MCTNLMLSFPNVPSTDDHGTVYASARTMEFTANTGFSLYLVPSSSTHPLVPPATPNRAEWQSRLGFVAVGPGAEAFDKSGLFVDGLNEAGLSAAALWLPGAKYPGAGSTPGKHLWYSDFVAWALGNFSSVQDLASALGGPGYGVAGEINIVGPPSSDHKAYLPLHYIVTDSTGASVIVECVDGATQVYACTDGVLANAPPYPWHLANLLNYSNLSVLCANSPAPTGSGLVGMPGDPMSASRFVRAATWVKGMQRLSSVGAGWLPAPGGLPVDQGGSPAAQTIANIAMQLIQGVTATPYGTLLQPGSGSDPPTVGDWTIWSVVRDHTNGVFYFTSAFNGIMRSIDVAQAVSRCPPASFPNFPTIGLMPSTSPWCVDAAPEFQPPLTGSTSASSS